MVTQWIFSIKKKKGCRKQFSASFYTMYCLKQFRNAIILIGKPLNTLSYTNTAPVEVSEDRKYINMGDIRN